MLNLTDVAVRVAEKFGSVEEFNVKYFLHLADIYIRNERELYAMARGLDKFDSAGTVALGEALIHHVIKWDACDGEDYARRGWSLVAGNILPEGFCNIVIDGVVHPYLEEK